MTECGNAEMRDRLPDLLEPAGRTDLPAVRAHVDACAGCRAELELLATVRAVVLAPRVDVEGIARSVPPYRPATRWSRVARSPALRVAAGFALIVGLGTVMTRPSGRVAPDTADARPVAAAQNELQVAAPLGDLTDAELQDLLTEMDGIEAVPSTESDVVVLPAFDRSGA